MSGCDKIIGEMGMGTEIIKSQGATIRMLIIVVICSIMCNLFALTYFFYDRKLDSQFELDTISTNVIQDGNGYNSYIDGIGDIYNGTDDN